jgi:hypothetical protein
MIYLCFSAVKDRGMMGQGIFLGEAFLPLQEIQVNMKLHEMSSMLADQ